MKTKVGLFGIGLDTYWGQFNGLLDNLKGYQEQIRKKIEDYRVDVVPECESVPGPVLDIGNTNSRYRFSIGAKEFINSWSKQGLAHHCAIGVSHIADKIDKPGQIPGIDAVKIC